MKDGGPAFPCEVYNERLGADCQMEGLSIRDWFAGMALQGKVAHGPVDGEVDPSIPGVTALCYRIADAMLAERSKP